MIGNFSPYKMAAQVSMTHMMDTQTALMSVTFAISFSFNSVSGGDRKQRIAPGSRMAWQCALASSAGAVAEAYASR